MIKVSCPSCHSTYEVDENRLPTGGLRMRCPKCSESFQVHPDGSIAKSGGGASPAANNPPRRKPTQVGLGPNVSPPVPPSAQTQKGSSGSLDADLPRPFDDLDLPAPREAFGFTDLPAPKAQSRSLDFDPFDDGGFEDWPAPKAQTSPVGFDPFSDIDLPAPYEGPGGTDLPAPLPGGRAGSDVDLPAPRSGRGGSQGRFADEVDLPMALTDAELPRPSHRREVPEPIALDSDVPVALEEKDLPVVRGDFADLDGPERVHGGGPIELDLPDGDDLDLDMDFGEQAPAPAPPPPIGARFEPSGGDVSPGADRFSRDSAELDLSESDELELSELDAGDEVVRMPRPEGARPEVSMAPDRPKRPAGKRPAWLMKAVAALALLGLLVGIGYYSGTTKYGMFGVHLVEPFLPASGDAVVVTQAVEGAELVASSDTYAATRAALAQLKDAREDAGLNRSLMARSLLHESYYQVRYGQDAEHAETADALRLQLRRRGDEAPRVHVALAADALRNADMMTASSEIALAATDDATDTYVDLVAGEVALRKRDGQAAVVSFQSALKKHESARAQWGIARGLALLGQREESLAAAQAALDASPNHAGARVAVAEQRVSEGQLEEAAALLRAPAGLEPVEGRTLEVARSDKSAALALLARIEERRGKLGAARELYEKAIELDTGNTPAALGAAGLVLLEGVYPDALARFQTVLGSTIPPGAEMDPTGKPRIVVEAKLGAAEALLAMDKPDEAQKILADLDAPEPANAQVETWLGNVAAAQGDTKEAVRHFRNALRLEPAAIRAYIALAKHYADTRRPNEAVAVLVEAQKNVEITAEVRRLLGWTQLQRGALDEAIEQFRAAIESEPADPSAKFGLAQAYRRKRMFDEAEAALDEVAALDAKFPTLQLERGRLAEARGDTGAAIAGYRAALEETPNDAALQSRLGATTADAPRSRLSETPGNHRIPFLLFQVAKLFEASFF